MVISCDIDCVLNTLIEAVLKQYNILSGDNLTENDITDYDVSKFIKPQYKEDLRMLWGDPLTWKYVDWDLKFVAEIIKKGLDDVYFTTATYPEHIGFKYNLLYRELAKAVGWTEDEAKIFVNGHLIMMQDKHLMRADVVIDDCMDALQLTNDNVYNILVAKPWNIKLAHKYNALYLTNKRIIICDDTGDIPEIIETIRNNKKGLWTKKWGNIT